LACCDATSTASAVQSIVNDPNAISDLPATLVSINGQTYSTSLKSDSNAGGLSSNWTATIVIIVVGIIGSALVVLAVHFVMQKYEKQQDRLRLIDKSKDQHFVDGNENIDQSIEGKTVDFKLTRRNSTSGGILQKKPNQVTPMLKNNLDIDRPPSASVSVNMLHFAATNNDNPVSAAQLNKFD
jgi:hypothetical protein